MGEIIIIGLGYELGQLTLDAIDMLRSGAHILLHTEKCGCADWLKMQGIPYQSLDALYETSEDFDEHIQSVVEAVLSAADVRNVVYGVFDVRDRSATELVRRAGKRVHIIAGPPVEGSLWAYTSTQVQLVEASDWERFDLSASRTTLVRELNDRALAGEVKLRLMENYPEECTIFVRMPDGNIARTELYNLDRLGEYDHRSCVLVPAQDDLMQLERYDFNQLRQIIARLCAPDGCPWDRVQTHKSLRPYMIEEAYEVVDAIDEDDPDHLYDELGDMLLQVVLHAEIARRHGEFDAMDVTTAIAQKMIHRHTHIFGGEHVENVGQLGELWSRNKMAERGQTTRTETLRDVTRTLPATLRAAKVLKRCEGCGLKDADLQELVQEATEALAALPQSLDPEVAAGEILLRLASVVRACKVDPELALNAAVDRLIDRFERLEQEMLNRGETFETATAETLQEYWRLVKLSDAGQIVQE